jgi:hypothetical protein
MSPVTVIRQAAQDPQSAQLREKSENAFCPPFYLASLIMLRAICGKKWMRNGLSVVRRWPNNASAVSENWREQKKARVTYVYVPVGFLAASNIYAPKRCDQ